MQTGAFALQGLMPAHTPELSARRAVALPYGGPYGTGGSYAAGLVLGLAVGTAQSEVMTLTISTATGTITNTFTADKVYVVTHLYNDTLAVVKAAWEAVFGAGNVAVTGTAGTTYILTLQGQLANKRMGGLLAVSSNDASSTWARTTRGNCGLEQYDVYDNSGVTTIDAFLKDTTTLNPRGGRATDLGSGTDQPFASPAYLEGFFNYGDLTGILTAGIGSGKKVAFSTGSSSFTTGAILRLSQSL